MDEIRGGRFSKKNKKKKKVEKKINVKKERGENECDEETAKRVTEIIWKAILTPIEWSKEEEE